MPGETPPAEPLRVLIVNDSATQRVALRMALAEEPGVEVVGEVPDGYAATSTVIRLRPSVVLLDVVMPGMDGFATAREIMARTPTPIVMITAAADAKSSELILEAMRARALAVTQGLPPRTAPGYVQRRRALAQLLRSMAQVRVGPPPGSSPELPASQDGIPTRPRALPERSKPISLQEPAPTPQGPIVAVGMVASAGGPNAIADILAELPRRVVPPILIVQHIAPGFAPGFASWLAQRTGYPTDLAQQGEALRVGRAYVAPEDRHLGVNALGRVALSDAPPVGYFRPSGTWLLRSLAQTLGPRALGIILSGMGDDGADGTVALRRAGGRVVAQDQQSSVVFGMPKEAIVREGADDVLPLTAIPGWILRWIRSTG
ncbi:chemotaxis protein CheB [Chondromyces apiculatus]|nr:chemotaxis protein CheB [Chondromyces apiculatus]